MGEINNLLKSFEELTVSPEELLTQGNLTDRFKCLLKSIYDFSKASKTYNKNALPELIIENFDEEQIWQELEIDNQESNAKFFSDVAKILVGKKSITFPLSLEQQNEEISNTLDNPDSEVGMKHKRKRKLDSDKEQRIKKIKFADDVTHEGDKRKNKKKSKIKMEDLSAVPKSEDDHTKQNEYEHPDIEDKFFKLAEMEEFADAGENKSSAFDNDGIDYFFGDEAADTDTFGEDGLKYSDFFNHPNAEADKEGKRKPKVERDSLTNLEEGSEDEELCSEVDDVNEIIDDDNDTDDDDDNNDFDDDDISAEGEFDEEDIDDENMEQDKNIVDRKKNVFESEDEEKEDVDKSEFEIRDKRMREKIAKMEAEALDEKPWQLKGEVTAQGRPINSLLEEFVEFDVTQRPAPVITEETTHQLEDIILRRIRDKVFDDVERKIKPVETPGEFKHKLVLNQEKSKLSLAEIYEQEYIKQRDAKNVPEDKEEEKPEEVLQIEKKMEELFRKLDALSNFQFTAKKAIPDLKVVSNLPALTMEEVAPLTTTTASLLAPEEVAGKAKQKLLGKEERTSTDKKRARRKKKQLIKVKNMMHKSKEQEKAAKAAESQGKNKWKVTPSSDVKLFQAKNLSQLHTSDGGKTVKTSNQFFNKLSEIKQVSKVKGSNTKTDIKAKKFKL